MGLLNRVENELVRPILRWARPSRHVRFAGIDISYRSELDEGGTEFGQQFIPFLKSRGMPKLKRAFEWCCGPGFIGFSMLGMASVKLFAHPTSTRQRFLRANTPCASTSLATAFLFISPTI